jgi:integrase/recombinase XerD
MNIFNVTSRVILDDRRQKENGLFPLKLRVTFNRNRKYYKIGKELSKSDFEKLHRAREMRLVNIKNELVSIESKAINIIDKLEPFSFLKFEEGMFPKQSVFYSKGNDVFNLFQNYIFELRAKNSFNTAYIYQSTLSALKAYRPKLKFDQINAQFLASFEQNLTLNGKSITTISLHLRNLRAVFNQPIVKNLVSAEMYPFKSKNYKIPASNNIKKALKISEIKAIYDYPTEPMGALDRAKDFWLFSYFCNGINIKDICLLQWKNLEEDSITFFRAKTSSTTKEKLTPIEIVVNEDCHKIIQKWGTNPLKSKYIFDIITPNLLPEKQNDKIKGFTKTINKYLSRIGTDLNFKLPLTTYVARHSYATIMHTSNVPLLLISKSLGHSSIETTENYLASFKKESVIEFNKNLKNW